MYYNYIGALGIGSKIEIIGQSLWNFLNPNIYIILYHLGVEQKQTFFRFVLVRTLYNIVLYWTVH